MRAIIDTTFQFWRDCRWHLENRISVFTLYYRYNRWGHDFTLYAHVVIIHIFANDGPEKICYFFVLFCLEIIISSLLLFIVYSFFYWKMLCFLKCIQITKNKLKRCCRSCKRRGVSQKPRTIAKSKIHLKFARLKVSTLC